MRMSHLSSLYTLTTYVLSLGVCIVDGYPYHVIDLHTCIRWSLIWSIKTPRLFPNPSLTWTVSLYHTWHNNGMICLLITTKTLFYWANADENGFLHIFSTGNLLNSRELWQTRTCAKEWKCTVHMSTKVAGQVFFILHRRITAKGVDFMHF